MKDNRTWNLAEITTLLFDNYGLKVDRLELLDLGADANSRVYKVHTAQNSLFYFLKTRPYCVHLPGVEIPAYLSQSGIPHILSSIPTQTGEPAFRYGDHSFILYPFLEGGTAMDKGLSPQQWLELGSTLQAVHNVTLPEDLAQSLARESFSPQSRSQAEYFMQRIVAGEMNQGLGACVAHCLQKHQLEIRHLLERAETLGQKLSSQSEVTLVPCHADLHKWNIFVTDSSEMVVIDWDSLKLAPKECDLMYIGGNIGGNKGDPHEISGFYKGYLSSEINPEIIAYYRFERIAEDIYEFCKQVWQGPDLSQSECEKIASWLDGNFNPGCEYETACQCDKN